MLKVNVTNGRPDEMILVLSESYPRFRNWCRDNGISLLARNIKFVGRVDQLQGYHGEWYATAGDVPAVLIAHASRLELRDVTGA